MPTNKIAQCTSLLSNHAPTLSLSLFLNRSLTLSVTFSHQSKQVHRTPNHFTWTYNKTNPFGVQQHTTLHQLSSVEASDEVSLLVVYFVGCSVLLSSITTFLCLLVICFVHFITQMIKNLLFVMCQTWSHLLLPFQSHLFNDLLRGSVNGAQRVIVLRVNVCMCILWVSMCVVASTTAEHIESLLRVWHRISLLNRSSANIII